MMNLKRVNSLDIEVGKKYLIFHSLFYEFRVVEAAGLDEDDETIYLWEYSWEYASDAGESLRFEDIIAIFELPETLKFGFDEYYREWFDENCPYD